MKRSNVSTSSALRAAGGIASNFRFWRSGADSDVSHINGVQYQNHLNFTPDAGSSSRTHGLAREKSFLKSSR